MKDRSGKRTDYDVQGGEYVEHSQLTKEEFTVLFNITNSWQSDPERASDGSVEDLAMQRQIFTRLGEKGLIKIDHREGQVYGAVATEAGENVLREKKYREWLEKLH